ncbi:alpha/beta hydrolase fold protein [Haloferax elongans ATCC BAA-1513]|uniref:Alpha/beta hydrolase fold protein n=1 Tax=Haloferax elongans ATCC BAA-1513 TaxID=1230453 RepID=M0HB97_HALEO|nr:alpha/beta fold hydrolase [Haloferax elongans]ELZ81058.1 alpha/beta hydrolase fold protein [Haloferax elongans ATCC BAA-1513]
MSLVAHDVHASDGTRLRIWERTPDEAEEAVLFLHGGMTSSEALLAPPVPDDDSYSWLSRAAEHGQAVFALDVRGYGESERPPEMQAPPEAHDPPVRASDAVMDIEAGFEFVRERFDAVHLVGISWGTMTGGTFVSEHSPNLESLVMCAPVYLPPYDFEEGLAGLGLDPDLDAYYKEEKQTVMARQGMDEPTPLFEAIWQTQVNSNQGVEGEDAYVAQTGALADVRDGCEGNPVYDADAIDTPTLVVRGSDDPVAQRPDALALYDDLGATEKQYHEIGGGTHFAMHGPHRQTLYDTVYDFQQRA